MDKNNYSCNCTVGNMSTIETEMMKDALVKFLESFYCKDYTNEKVSPLDDGKYYYAFKIKFSNSSMLKVKRFSESLIQFCLFWGISIYEN